MTKVNIPAHVNQNIVNNILREKFGFKINPGTTTFVTFFNAMFGVRIDICIDVWNEMVTYSYLLPEHKFEHFLWTLNFLKVYSPFRVLASNTGVSLMTYQKWVWNTIDAICKIEVVSMFVNF
jgi:hypothetical protein